MKFRYIRYQFQDPTYQTRSTFLTICVENKEYPNARSLLTLAVRSSISFPVSRFQSQHKPTAFHTISMPNQYQKTCFKQCSPTLPNHHNKFSFSPTISLMQSFPVPIKPPKTTTIRPTFQNPTSIEPSQNISLRPFTPLPIYHGCHLDSAPLCNTYRTNPFANRTYLAHSTDIRSYNSMSYNPDMGENSRS